MYAVYEQDALPEEDKGVDGVKHTVDYKGENLYVVIIWKKCEVFISSVKQDQDPKTGAAIDALSRLTTLAWKGSTVDTVIDQLRKSSRVKNDLPGIIARLLSEEFI